MGKLIDTLLSPEKFASEQEHVSDCEIAALAEGGLSGGRRQRVMEHILNCPDCYESFGNTVKALDNDQHKPVKANTFQKTIYALAASVMLVFLLSTGVYYWKVVTPQIVTARVELDQDLQSLLLQASKGTWTDKDRKKRLVRILKEKGLQVASVEKVVLTERYFASKDLFGPKEYLLVTIEDGVARIKVVEEEED